MTVKAFCSRVVNRTKNKTNKRTEVSLSEYIYILATRISLIFFSSLYLTLEDREVRSWKSEDRNEGGKKDRKKEGKKTLSSVLECLLEKENLV